MFAEVRGTTIFFDVEGSSLVPGGERMVERPVAFVLHGGPGADHSLYKPALTPLSEIMQLVYIDHRGQGRSAPSPKEACTLENNIEDIEALRVYLGLDKIVLFGASYGGIVALSYAVRYPERVSHLIAAVTTPSHRFLDQAKEVLRQRASPEQREAAQALWEGTFQNEEELQRYFDLFGPLYSLKYDPEEAEDAWGRTILSVDAINQGFATFLRTYDVTEELSNISCPTLVIGARHDWICAPEFSELIAQHIPNCDVRIFENSSHLVWGDEYQEFIDTVRGFMVYQSIS